MAWGATASIGGVNNKTSQTSVSFTLTNAVAVNAAIFIGYAMDNAQTTDGASTLVTSITDSKGNTYTRVREHTNGNGTAATGVTCGLWFSSCTVALTTTDTITVHFATTTAKAIVGLSASPQAGFKGVEVGSNQGGVADAATSGPSTTLGGLPSAEHYWIAVDALEGPSGDTYTIDTDFSSQNRRGSSGSTDNLNMTVSMQKSLFTGTTRTHRGTNSLARDWASVLAAFDETSAGTEYTDSGTVTATFTATASDAQDAVDATTATATFTATASDVQDAVDSGAADAVFTASGTDPADFADSGTVTANFTITATEEVVREYVDSGTVTANFTATTVESVDYVDTSTAAAVFTASATEFSDRTDTSTATAVFTATAVEEVIRDFTDSGTVTITLTASASDYQDATDATTASVVFTARATAEEYIHPMPGNIYMFQRRHNVRP